MNAKAAIAKTAETMIAPVVAIAVRAKASVVPPAVIVNKKATKTVATKVGTNHVVEDTRLALASSTATPAEPTATADMVTVTAVLPKAVATAAERKTAVSASTTPSASTRASNV